MQTVIFLLGSLLVSGLAIALFHATCEARGWQAGYDSLLMQLGVAKANESYWHAMWEHVGQLLADSRDRKALWRALKSVQNHKQRWLGALEHIESLQVALEERHVRMSELLGTIVDKDEALQRAYGLHAVLVDKLETSESMARHYEHGRNVMRQHALRLLVERNEAQRVADELRATLLSLTTAPQQPQRTLSLAS